MDFEQKLESNYYMNNLEYPTRVRCVCKHYVINGKANFCPECGVNVSERYADFVQRRSDYHLESAKLEKAFKSDLLECLGIADHPKAEVLYELAWARGHSCGHYQVYECALELLRLII